MTIEAGNTAISFDGVSKDFRFFASPLQRLREAFHPAGRRFHVPVPVLRNLSFSVERGQTVAIIGANGVGKSTMLHLVAGLLEPSSGTVSVNGRVMGLLDLGGSFLPDLTGRENARFFHEVAFRDDTDRDERERAIETFADIGEFFDRPVRTYSSGMFLRLAFASATVAAPDILLIDEILAVGDARFQQKCFRRLREMRDHGTTTLLVTHFVQGLPGLCDRVIVLEHGEIVFDGDPGPGVDRYYQLFFMSPARPASAVSKAEFRYGSGGARIERAFASHDGSRELAAIDAGDSVTIVFDVEFEQAVEAPQFGFSCSTTEGVRIYTTTTGMLGESPLPAAAGERRRVEVAFNANVAVSDLFIDLSVFEVAHGTINVFDVHIGILHLAVKSSHRCAGITDLSAVIRG